MFIIMMKGYILKLSVVVTCFSNIASCALAAPRREHEGRKVRQATLPLTNIPISVFTDNLTMSCDDPALKIYKKLTFDTEAMKKLLTSLGGDWTPHYSAPDPTAAQATFKNLLQMSDEYEDVVFKKINNEKKFDARRDNFITKQAILDDLHQINALNSQHSNRTTSAKTNAKGNEKAQNSKMGSKQLEYILAPDFERRSMRKRRTVVDDPTATVTTIEYCVNRGTVNNDGFLPMCTTCAATTILPDDRFPRVLNEAVCQNGDRSCLNIKGTSHGSCKQRIFNINMLRKVAGRCHLHRINSEVYVMEHWELYTQPIRVCCECMIKRLSMFAAYITK